MPDPLRFRQSRLRSYTSCPRRTIHESENTVGFVGAAAHLGSAFHAVAAEILRTLHRYGEKQMPTEEAINVMRETLAAGEWVLAMDDLAWLRQMVLRFTELEWQPQRFMTIEERYHTDVLCPDGELRTISGTPDLVIADAPSGAIALDWKTGLGVPRTPRELPEEGQPIRGTDYLSEGGYAQLAIYGLLIMRRYPRVGQVILREQNVRWGGPPREATLARAELEHVEREVGLIAMQLDTALREGEGHALSEPRPGPWCTTRCPVARSCPIPQEQRGLGALATPEDATAEAERLQVISALRDQMTKALKARHEATGEFIKVGSGELLGWHVNDGGKRRFELRKP